MNLIDNPNGTKRGKLARYPKFKAEGNDPIALQMIIYLETQQPNNKQMIRKFRKLLSR